MPIKKCGYTIVEVLIVISIVSILIALLIPAIQMIRNSAQRSACGNKLRQIGLATMQFESARQHLPTPTFSARYSQAEYVSDRGILVQLLPYLDQRPLFDEFQLDTTTFDPSNQHAFAQGVDLFNCPSSGGQTMLKDLASYYGDSPHSDLSSYTCDYVGNGGFSGRLTDPARFKPLFDIHVTGLTHSRINYDFVRKGLSNTFAFWESSGRSLVIYQNKQKREVDWNDLPSAWSYNEVVFPKNQALPFDFWTLPDVDTKHANLRSYRASWAGLRVGRISAWNSEGSEYGFVPAEGGGISINLSNSVGNPYSNHFGGCNFVYCDGSVSFVSKNADSRVLIILSSIDETEVFDRY